MRVAEIWRYPVRSMAGERRSSKLRARCVMTTFDPDTQEQDLSVLRRIAAGDPAELVDPEG